MQKRYLKTVNKSRKNKMASFSCHGFLMLSFTLILNFVKRIKKGVFYILVLGRNIYLFYLECILILNGRKAPLRGHSTYAIENERPRYGDIICHRKRKAPIRGHEKNSVFISFIYHRCSFL